MARTTRRRYSSRGGSASAITYLRDPAAAQMDLLKAELDRAKVEDSLAALSENNPERFIETAERLIAEGHPDSARLQGLVSASRQRLSEMQWEMDIKSGAKSYEQFQNYLEQRLNSAPQGSMDASRIISSIAAVTTAIRARDEAKRDQVALLDYLKTEDNIKYATYLRDKLIRTTDPAMQKAIIAQVNDLSARQDKKEAVQRTVRRQQTVQEYMSGVTSIEGAVQAMAALRDSASSPEEVTSIQKDINALFQNDIAKKRNEVLTLWTQQKIGAGEAIARLQTLATGPADESSVNALTTAIDHVRSVAKSQASAAAGQGRSDFARESTNAYNAAVADINRAVREGRSPTEVEIRTLREAATTLSDAEAALSNYYYERGNDASGKTWADRSAGREDGVAKLLVAVDDAAFKRAGVTATDAAAFETSIGKLDPDKQVEAVIAELKRISEVQGITAQGTDKAKDVYQRTLARGQAAAAAAEKLNEQEEGTLTQVYADYVSRARFAGATALPKTAFDAYLKDLNRGVLSLDQFNTVIGFGMIHKEGPQWGGPTDVPHQMNYTQEDRPLQDASLALGGGRLRSESLGDKLATEAWDIAREGLTKKQTDSYLETMRETTRGTRRPTIEPIVPPISGIAGGMDTSALADAVPPDIQAELEMLRASQAAKSGDVFSRAYDSLMNTPSNFEMPNWNLPDLPPAAPLVFGDIGAFNIDTPDLILTEGDTLPPPQGGGGNELLQA